MANRDWRESLKAPFRKLKNRLSHSRAPSPNPLVDERPGDQSRSLPATRSLPRKIDNATTVIPRPRMEPSDDIPVTSKAEESAAPANTTLSAAQQGPLHQPVSSDSRVDTKSVPSGAIIDRPKPPLHAVRSGLSRSRISSLNPSIDETDQGRSRPSTPSPSSLPHKSDNAATVLPRPPMEPDDDISTTPKAEAVAVPTITISAADQQASLHQPASSNARLNTKPNAPTQTFARSKYLQRDIGVLHAAYVLQESSELRDLIREVVKINSDERFKDALEPSVSIAADLIVALDLGPVPDGVSNAISTFLGVLKAIDWTKSLPNEVLSIVQRSISQIKSTYPHIFAEDRQRSSRFKAITSGVLGITLPILDILKDASSMTPVPMLQPLIGVIAGFLKAADEASNNFEWMRWLAATAAEFIVRIAVICPYMADEHWMRVINNLRLKLSGIVNQATEFSRRSVVSRFLGHGKDKGDIEFMKEELRAAINFFSAEMHIEHKFDLENMSRNIESLLLEQLPRLPEHSLSHDRYFSGSRRDEIQATLEWVEADRGEHLLWYHGAAGVGKSTYARELLNHIKDEGMLGAFAYFAIGFDVNPKDLVRMMARELADLHPGCRPAVSSAIKNCAGANRGLDEYITHFLVKPIFSLSYSGPLVIILDALDEWVHHEVFLLTLVRNDRPSHTRALKFIMTSRYSARISTIISSKAHICKLTPVSATVCYDYFKGRFDGIDWDGHYPDSDILERLVKLADGLLIWAATVCTLVSEPSPHDGPYDILESIVSSSSKVARVDRMEVLYRLAIERIFTNDSEGSKQSRHNILLAMSALQEVLPLEDFSRLAGLIRTKFVKETLIGMRAIQTRGTFSETMVQPAIKLFHASFIDYLGTLEEAHAAMAHHSISFLKQSQDTLADIGEKLFRPAELYIGKHFADHLCKMSPDLVSKSTQELESCHIRKWVAWSLARLMVIGEANGFPAGSHSLLTLSESLLHEHGITYSPELVSRDETLILGVVTDFSTVLELVGIFRGDELSTGGDDYVQYKHGVDKWVHVINGVIIGHLQLQQLEDPLSFSDCVQTRRLESAIKLLMGICAVLPSCPLSIQENHALALELGFGYSGALCDLEEALTLHQNVQTCLSEKTPGYTTFLNNFAHALHTQFQYDANCSINVLHMSISLHQQAVAHDPNNHHKRATFLDNLGVALHTKYLVEGPKNPTVAITEIINYHQEAIRLRSNHLMHLPLLLNNLSFALQSRSHLQKESTIADLAQALSCSLQAVSADNLGRLEHSTYITTLGYVLCLVSHMQPQTPSHCIVTPEQVAQFTALAFKKGLFSAATITMTSTIKKRLEELAIVVQRVENIVVPRQLKDLVKRAKWAESTQVMRVQEPILWLSQLISPGALLMLDHVVRPGRMVNLVRLAEPARLVELVKLTELGFLGLLAKDVHLLGQEKTMTVDRFVTLAGLARRMELTKLAQLAELAEEVKLETEARLAKCPGQVERQAEQSRAGEVRQAQQNKELAKRIKELLYDIALAALCSRLVHQALSTSPPGALCQSVTILLKDNIEDGWPVRGGALLRLRARPLAALAEIDRRRLMKAAKAFSQPSDSEMESPSD